MNKSFKQWMDSGMPWVWLTAASVSISVMIVVGLLALIAVRGLGHFWPAAVLDMQYQEPGGKQIRLIGEIHGSETVPWMRLDKDSQAAVGSGVEWAERKLLKTGNRDALGIDFRWLLAATIQTTEYPADALVIERREWGNAYGFMENIKENGQAVTNAGWDELQLRLARADDLSAQIAVIEKGEMSRINYQLERLRLRERKLQLEKNDDPAKKADIAEQRAQYQAEYTELQARLEKLYQENKRDSMGIKIMDGRVMDVPLAKVVQVYRPNAMNVLQKMGFYGHSLWAFVSTDPREANTEGGIFPAIFGTVIMVLIMSIFVTPFGVIAAVYLREYAKQGFLTRTVRIAVNNLAGVPSIVYGVFGLGFFVYFLGGSIDEIFYPESLPAPVFGSGGVLWSSLTLALLTLPVVIVSTEEGLTRIPRAIREGSLALGATKAETLWRTVLPMASPAIMTGMILAIARAAGEVAPLMLVGVVKLAPALAADANAPFVHLERKFMHLGFHIYDVGFQSPNVEAARPLVYATSVLLVLVIVALNVTAIWIRNRLREKYRSLETI